MQSTYLKPWYLEEVGAAIFAQEQQIIAEALATGFGYHLLFLSPYAVSHILASSLIMHKIWVSPDCIDAAPYSGVRAIIEALPLANDSIDVSVLFHALETAADPYQVLAEVHRVMHAEGTLIVSGFNPWSLWGLFKTLAAYFGAAPKPDYIAAWRVRAWLEFLGFQLEDHRPVFFAPPLRCCLKYAPFFGRCATFLGKIGGAAYTIVAVKRELQIIPLAPIPAREIMAPWGVSCPAQQRDAVQGAPGAALR